MPCPIVQPLDIFPLTERIGLKRMPVEMTRLERENCGSQANLDDPKQLISFGMSGHRRWSNLRRPEGEIRDASPDLIRLAWWSRAGHARAPLHRQSAREDKAGSST